MQKGLAPILIVLLLILIIISSFVLKNTAEELSTQSSYELYQTKNRTEALNKAQLAANLWPFDQTYKKRLDELKQIYDRPAILIYFLHASPNDIQSLKNEISSINGVKNINYISQDHALKMYKDLHKNDPLLLSMVTKDILPDSLEVYLNDYTIRGQIEQVAKKKSFVSTVVQSI